MSLTTDSWSVPKKPEQSTSSPATSGTSRFQSLRGSRLSARPNLLRFSWNNGIVLHPMTVSISLPSTGSTHVIGKRPMATVEKKTTTITSKLTSDGEVFVHYLLQL